MQEIITRTLPRSHDPRGEIVETVSVNELDTVVTVTTEDGSQTRVRSYIVEQGAAQWARYTLILAEDEEHKRQTRPIKALGRFAGVMLGSALLVWLFAAIVERMGFIDGAGRDAVALVVFAMAAFAVLQQALMAHRAYQAASVSRAFGYIVDEARTPEIVVSEAEAWSETIQGPGNMYHMPLSTTKRELIETYLTPEDALWIKQAATDGHNHAIAFVDALLAEYVVAYDSDKRQAERDRKQLEAAATKLLQKRAAARDALHREP